MLDWVLGRKKRKKKNDGRKRPTYDKARRIAAEGSLNERRELASNEDVEPEILYYFAADEASEIRLEVARNQGTPLQADEILSCDEDDEVRCELAHKIGRLVPAFSKEEQQRLTEMAIKVLEILAEDQLPRVRAIIAEEIKHATNVPGHIVQQLARDVEGIVAAPVLQYSPLLNSSDLLEIIARGIGKDALKALSRRDDLMEPVAEAVVNTRNVQATKALLANKTANISVATLEIIATVAAGAPQLHKPIVERENLPLRMIRRVACFVNSSLVEILIKRSGLDEDIADSLRQTVRNRIDHGDLDDNVADNAAGQAGDEKAKKMYEEDRLDETAIIQAIENKNMVFICQALMLLSGISVDTVKEMLASKSGKAVAALSWKSGIGMQTAMDLQTRIAHVPAKSIISSSDNDYPMTKDELDWYIEYFAG